MFLWGNQANTQENPTLKRIQVPTQWMLLSPGTSAMTFITCANFFQTFFFVHFSSAVFFYSSKSGLFYLPGNFATTSTSNHLPSAYGWDVFLTTMLQNPCRITMTVTKPTENPQTFVFLPSLGLFYFWLSSWDHTLLSHTSNLRIQRVASNRNRKWGQRKGREKQKQDDVKVSLCFLEKQWTEFNFRLTEIWRLFRNQQANVMHAEIWLADCAQPQHFGWLGNKTSQVTRSTGVGRVRGGDLMWPHVGHRFLHVWKGKGWGQ